MIARELTGARMTAYERADPDDLFGDLARYLALARQSRSRRRAVRTSDLGGRSDTHQDAQRHSPTSKEVLLRYLQSLERVFLLALCTMLGSILTAAVALVDLFVFIRIGSSFLHPWLDFFLLIGSAGMLSVAVASALSTRRYLAQTIRRIADWC
jgi:hypothetical protein